jgi:hypothetical protein
MIKKRLMRNLTEDEIDRLVVAEADRRSAWEKSVRVRRPKKSSLKIPSDLAARASFLARLHGSAGLDEWVAHVLRERIELEEGAFSRAQRDLSGGGVPHQPRQRPAKSRR